MVDQKTIPYRSAIVKLNLRPWKLFLSFLLFAIIFGVLNNFIQGAILIVPLFIAMILLLDSIATKIRDIFKK